MKTLLIGISLLGLLACNTKSTHDIEFTFNGRTIEEINRWQDSCQKLMDEGKLRPGDVGFTGDAWEWFEKHPTK